MLKRRLRPFQPALDLPMHEVATDDDSVLGNVNYMEEYGFDSGSMQHNFFKPSASTKARKVAMVLHTNTRGPPDSLNAATVVARLFGVLRGSDFEIWHVSVNKEHALNDSKAGIRWGVYGIRLDDVPTKPRWYDSEDRQVTKLNSEHNVRGTPNPYATQCLYRTLRGLACKSARQHESMACAQLFDTQYSHRTHPATQLIYRTLGFEKQRGLDAYSWDSNTMVSLESSWKRFVFRMSKGIPSIFDASTQRRLFDGPVVARVCSCSLMD